MPKGERKALREQIDQIHVCLKAKVLREQIDQIHVCLKAKALREQIDQIHVCLKAKALREQIDQIHVCIMPRMPSGLKIIMCIHIVCSTENLHKIYCLKKLV